MIDLTAKVDGVGWYDSKIVGELAIALKAGDDKVNVDYEIRRFQNFDHWHDKKNDIKYQAQDMIFKSSMKSAMYSALSQTSKVDAALVVFLNLQLVVAHSFNNTVSYLHTAQTVCYKRILQYSAENFYKLGVRRSELLKRKKRYRKLAKKSKKN